MGRVKELHGSPKIQKRATTKPLPPAQISGIETPPRVVVAVVAVVVVVVLETAEKRCVCPHRTDPDEGLDSPLIMHDWWPDTWEKLTASAPPPALDDEELFIIEGSPAATGAQLRDNPEEREKCGKNRKKTLQ